MNSQHRELRALLSVMAPKRAISYIESFCLPEMEENCIIICDVRRKSCVEAARLLNLSPDSVKRARRRAYTKIADAVNNSET